jgi:hypothetical protein
MDTRNDNDMVRHDDHSTAGDAVGEGVGGVSGVLAGAAIGSLGGPIGTVIGGIAGAIGGWWAGREISEAARHYTESDDAFYRNHYEASDRRLADRPYDQVRPAYQLGHIAGQNPDYRGRSFEAVEPDLRRGWDSATSDAHGSWDQVRDYARDAYSRSLGLHAEPHHISDRQDAAAEQADKRIDDTMGVNLF